MDARDYQANRADYLAVEFHTPKWAWVDPEKDVKGEILAIRAGLKSRSMSINEAGMDEEDVDRQIKRDNDRADELELVFDSDPRRTDMRGAEKVEATSPDNVGDIGGGTQNKKPPKAAPTPGKKRGDGSIKEVIQ